MPCAAPPDAPGLIDSAWGRSTTAACTFARESPSSESSGWCAPNTRREHTQAQQRVQALAASQLVLACTQRASGLWRGLRTGLVWLSRRLAPSMPLPFSSPHAGHLWSSLVQQTPHQTHQSTQPHQPHLASSAMGFALLPRCLPPHTRAHTHTRTHTHTHLPSLCPSPPAHLAVFHGGGAQHGRRVVPRRLGGECRGRLICLLHCRVHLRRLPRHLRLAHLEGSCEAQRAGAARG